MTRGTFLVRHDRLVLFAIVLAAVAIRIAAMRVLAQPLENDSRGYLMMAQGLAQHGVPVDQYGLHIFYSAGYPLVLAPFFAVFGAGVPVALAVNLGLTVATVALVHRLTLTTSENRLAALVAAIAYAVWLPAIWNATILAKENLSTPLLLGLVLCALQVARGRSPRAYGATAGLLWGASLVTGGSTLLLFVPVGVALVLLRRIPAAASRVSAAGLCFLSGAAIVMVPWLGATDAMVGRPVFTTNAPFNLYIGNNPAATGRFVSMAATPLGKEWNAIRLKRGEIGSADFLQAQATDWIGAHPWHAARLAALKLVYFWLPNVPDSADIGGSAVVAAIRIAEVVQYLIYVLCGFAAFGTPEIARDGKWIVGATILGFWLVHAAAYIILRYRDPIVPLLIVMGSVPVARLVAHRRRTDRTMRHAG